MRGLTAKQIAFYKDQGYLLVEDVIPVEDLQPLISELNETVDQNAPKNAREGRAIRAL